MMNGDSINPSIDEVGVGPGTPLVQGVFSLPYPGRENNYIVFTLDLPLVFPMGSPYLAIVPQNLLYHIVDMTLDSGLGAVTSKRQIAIQDTLARGYIQATRHANGRDWWVLVPIWNSNCYYIFLLDKFGIHTPEQQCLGLDFGDADLAGSVNFSPSGELFARIEADYGIVLMDIDRCSGTLSNAREINYPPDEPYFAGIGFSPKSRFLYITTRYHVWQYDLTDEDIEASRMLVGEVPEEYHGQVGTGSLYLQQIGPDHKIYIASPGNHYYLSTIEDPDKKGIACNFMPYSLFLSSSGGNYAGIPNHPNYRLGPIDGSSCDTLGIDNVPVAYFRYDTSETDPLDFEFTDLSYFEPVTWTWDFGDGVQSNEQNPGHTFVSPGVHEVCLEVSNVNGSDSFCRPLNIMLTGIEDIQQAKGLHVYPNPATKAFWISSVQGKDIRSVHCYDTSGKLVLALDNAPEQSLKVEVPQGIQMLFVEVILSDGTVKTTKIVVQD